MKKIFLFALFFVSLISVYAQDKTATKPLSDKIYINISSDCMLKSKDFSSMGVDFSIGWKFNQHFYVYVVENSAMNLLENKSLNVKDFKASNNLGGGLGYRFFMESGLKALDFKIATSTTVGNSKWKYTSYETGLFYRFLSRGLSPQIGLGYRYNDSRTSDFKSHGNLYGSIGFSF